jgi:hypothetical protein
MAVKFIELNNNMNILLDNTVIWFTELGITTRRLGGNIIIDNVELTNFGITPAELIIELRIALKANNLSFSEFENRTHIYAI